MNILFVTWDGPQTSYLESLFLPIFERLSNHGVHFDVLQFRWGDSEQAERIAALCRNSGIGYRAVTVRRAPAVIGPFATALFGAVAVREVVRDFRPDLLMPRSLMPALAVLAAGGRRLRPIVFDADGLEADERAEFRGLSRASLIYRMFRSIERRAAQQAESVLVRTGEAAAILSGRSSVEIERFHIVTNGRDPTIFRPPNEGERQQARAELQLDAGTPLLVYAGSIGPQYRLDLVAETFAALLQRSTEARLLVLTSNPSNAVNALEQQRPGIGRWTTALHAPPSRVPFYLGAADAGLAFRSDSFSKRAIAPIKLGEYLLCGLPVIGTRMAGSDRAAAASGVLLADSEGPERAAEWLLNAVLPDRDSFAGRARSIGLEFFSLERSVDDYLAAIGRTAEVRHNPYVC